MKSQEVEETLAYLGIEEDGNIDGELSNPHITSQTVPVALENVKAYLKITESEKRVFLFSIQRSLPPGML